jgi:hypothetical protein
MDLDDELRQLFTSDRLDVAIRPDATEIIVAGASRLRRRRIATATAGGALAVVAAVVAGLLLTNEDRNTMPPATITPTTERPTSSAVSSEVITSTSRTSSSTTQPETQNKPPSQSRSQSTSPPTGSSDEPVTDPADPDYPVVGPTGYGGIRLGMTLEEAQATGLLGSPNYDAEGGCPSYDLLVDGSPYASVSISDTVQAIYTSATQTPEGIGEGATFEQLKAVYPELEGQTVVSDRHVLVAAPGNPNGQYRFWFNEGVVTAVSLQFVNQECWG